MNYIYFRAGVGEELSGKYLHCPETDYLKELFLAVVNYGT